MNQKFQTYFLEVGALAIESISRGARNAIACDNSRKAIDIIKKNVAKTHFEEKIKILNKDFKKALKDVEGKSFDIIFLDPPYKTNFGAEAIEIIIEKNLLKKNGVIIFETDRDECIECSQKFAKVTDLRKYGRVKLVFLNRKE